MVLLILLLCCWKIENELFLCEDCGKQNIILTLLLSIELLICGVLIICDDVVWTFGVTENQSRKPSDAGESDPNSLGES